MSTAVATATAATGRRVRPGQDAAHGSVGSSVPSAGPTVAHLGAEPWTQRAATELRDRL